MTPLRASDYIVFDGAQIGRTFAQNYLAAKEQKRRAEQDKLELEQVRLNREARAEEGRLDRESRENMEIERSFRDDLRQESYMDRILKQQEGMNERNEADIKSREKIAGAKAFNDFVKSAFKFFSGSSGRGDGLGGERLNESQKVHHNNDIRAIWGSMDDTEKFNNKLIRNADGLLEIVPKVDASIPPAQTPAAPGSNNKYTDWGPDRTLNWRSTPERSTNASPSLPAGTPYRVPLGY